MPATLTKIASKPDESTGTFYTSIYAIAILSGTLYGMAYDGNLYKMTISGWQQIAYCTNSVYTLNKFGELFASEGTLFAINYNTAGVVFWAKWMGDTNVKNLSAQSLYHITPPQPLYGADHLGTAYITEANTQRAYKHTGEIADHGTYFNVSYKSMMSAGISTNAQLVSFSGTLYLVLRNGKMYSLSESPTGSTSSWAGDQLVDGGTASLVSAQLSSGTVGRKCVCVFAGGIYLAPKTGTAGSLFKWNQVSSVWDVVVAYNAATIGWDNIFTIGGSLFLTKSNDPKVYQFDGVNAINAVANSGNGSTTGYSDVIQDGTNCYLCSYLEDPSTIHSGVYPAYSGDIYQLTSAPDFPYPPTWVPGARAALITADAQPYRAHSYPAQFRRAAASAGRPAPIIIPPSQSSILPSSTGKISHARIFVGHKSESDAQTFHKRIKRINP